MMKPMIVWSMHEDPINEYNTLARKSRVKKSLGKENMQTNIREIYWKKSIGFHWLRRD